MYQPYKHPRDVAQSITEILPAFQKFQKQEILSFHFQLKILKFTHSPSLWAKLIYVGESLGRMDVMICHDSAGERFADYCPIVTVSCNINCLEQRFRNYSQGSYLTQTL